MYTATVATLVEHFHLTIPQIAELTDRQIRDIYFFPRDEHGALKYREEAHSDSTEEQTVENALRDWFTVGKALGLSLEEIEAGRQRIIEKFNGPEAEHEARQ